MQITIRPSLDPHREIDVTARLVAALADELSSQYGGSEALNRLEAEQHLARIVGQARTSGATPYLSASTGLPKRAEQMGACPGCPRRRAAERAGSLRAKEVRSAPAQSVRG